MSEKTYFQGGPKKVYVDIGHKQYVVTLYADGRASIWTSWETVNPATVWSAHPEMWHKSASVSPNGRLGRKVLKLAAELLNKEGTR